MEREGTGSLWWPAPVHRLEQRTGALEQQELLCSSPSPLGEDWSGAELLGVLDWSTFPFSEKRFLGYRRGRNRPENYESERLNSRERRRGPELGSLWKNPGPPSY